MKKTILLTGATDGIGYETAKMLVEQGHQVLLHGRNPDKLEQVTDELSAQGEVESYLADLSDLGAVQKLADAVSEKHQQLDVLINNAGVLKTPNPITPGGLDVRFVVNTIAPYLLTMRILPLFELSGRIVNLSSAAQSSVDLNAMTGSVQLTDMAAYSQSKLAITMWSRHLALAHPEGPVIVAVNPASMLGSKMVKEGFGVAGGDLRIGAEILVRAALSDEFTAASGKYYDNDSKCFTSPHPDALNKAKCEEVVHCIESLLKV
ncbi:MAG: SDR family NAD(P)-dependent oxidoreductase [Verrucomicrobiota bacterium]